MQKIIPLLFLPLSSFSQWIMQDNLPGPARDDATAGYYQGFIYTGNGRDEGFTVRGDWMKYDVQNKQWFQMGDAPFSRRQYGMAAAAEDGVYVLGGILSGQYFDDVWKYVPDDEQWVELPSFPFSLAQGMLLSWQNKLIAGLGRGDNTNDSLYVFEGDEWTFLTAFPGGKRHGTGHFISGNRLYVGWGKDDDDHIKSDWWSFDLQRDSWHQIESPPATPRWWCSSTAYPGGGGVVGLGMDEDETFMNDLWVYHPIQKNWTQLEGSLPTLRGANLLSDDTNLHLFWGVKGNFSRTPNHYISEENTLESKVVLYPNPTRDFVNIERIFSDGTNSWEIIDAQGRVCSQRECVSGIPCTFSVLELASGLYMARNAEENITIKFLVTH